MPLLLLLLTLGISVPDVELDGLEPAVANQLQNSRQLLAEGLDNDLLEESDQAALWGELGRLFHTYGFPEQALTAYKQAMTLAPQGAAWPYYIGMIEMDQGRSEQGYEMLNRALQLRPDELAIRLRVADALNRLGRTQEAAAMLETAVDLAPQEPAVMAAMGEFELEQRNYGNARQWLEAALQAQPKATRLHYPLALTLRALDEDELARKHMALVGSAGVRPPDAMLDALDQLRQGERVHLLRGRLAYQAGDYQAAIAYFSEARKHQSESAAASVNLAAALASNQQIDQAIEVLEQTRQSHPDNATALFNLGSLYRQAGQLDQARAALEAYEADYEYDAQAISELIAIDRHQGRYDAAMERCKRLLSVYSHDVSLWFTLAAIQTDAEQYAEARATLEAARQGAPEDGRLAQALARLLAAAPDLSVRDGQAAIPLAKALYEAQPTGSAANLVAMAYAEAGQCTTAADWLEQAAANVAPESAQALADRVTFLRSAEECRP
ncbi:MAG: hypothetical protein DHS20C11_26420 [Lysobacteraceae bacterium]|nr:MAG: hypothetical protein DHS20C11_26420 [Xanthomonadaceae bacterium]